MKNDYPKRLRLSQNKIKGRKHYRRNREFYQICLSETPLEKVEAETESKNEESGIIKNFQRLNQILTTYQFLFTIIIGILTVLYVQWVFDVSPFENQKNTSTNKKLAEFYQQLGDSLMNAGNYQESEKAFKAAIVLQPNNAKAIYGLTKIQVFNPGEGEKYYDPEIADDKIDYLIEQFPDNADLYYFKGANALDRLDFDEQKKWLEKSIALDDKSFRAYADYGYACLIAGDTVCAFEKYNKSLEIKQNSALANHGIGYCHLLQLDFVEAKKFLEKAALLSFKPSISFDLGEAFKYSGELENAILYHKAALNILYEEGMEKSFIIGGDWKHKRMPLSKENLELGSDYASTATLNEKKLWGHYLLIIDYALIKDFKAANMEFDKTVLLQKQLTDSQKNNLKNLFINRCLAAAAIVKPTEEIKDLLKKYSKKYCKENECREIDESFNF